MKGFSKFPKCEKGKSTSVFNGDSHTGLGHAKMTTEGMLNVARFILIDALCLNLKGLRNGSSCTTIYGNRRNGPMWGR